MNTTQTTPESTIAGLFPDSDSADRAIAELRTAGFDSNQIEELSGRTTADKGDGLMSGIMNFFGGASDTTKTDNTYGDLTRMGLDEEDARYFQNGLDAGGVLVTLRAGSRSMEALAILDRYGADTGVVEFEDATPTLPSTVAPVKPAATQATQGNQRIELLKEVLRVNKQKVQSGEVTLRKEVITENQTIEVPLTHEEIVIERHPVEGRETQGTIEAGQEIRVPLTEEQVTVEKRSVVVEEISVGKREVEETERVSDTVREEKLIVDRQGDVEVRGDKTRPVDPNKPVM
ncbi:MAG: YsnF/AvaK domain-containing protein [Gemmatimonadaceae bacterium]|nr:YsnF/AvaK domain-containing protein [Gloeobacterales cyanobacterium ES-bin-141]